MSSCRYLVIKAPKAILSSTSEVSAVSVLVDRSTGKIVQVGADADIDQQGADVMELSGGQLLIPGLVDAHVHLNEPGRTDWEGFETGTKAAAAGGIATVIDMPLNAIPPTTTVGNLNTKLVAAKGQCHVDVGFWGGVVPDNAEDLPGLMARGVRGFKCFLIESGVDEFPCVNEAQVRLAMDKMAGSEKVLLFHAEMESDHQDNDDNSNDDHPMDPRTYSSFLNSRPQQLETDAIDMIIRLTREYAQKGKPVKTHIVHLSAASALPAIRAAKAEGLPLTVETCFHYLNFSAEAIEDGATHYKCCPPIREASNREYLWEALLDGTIDYVVSDHSPCTAQLKKIEIGDFGKAWGGIASVQFGLPVLWSEGRTRGVTIQQLVGWLSEKPAARTGLNHKKGLIAPGFDADFCIWQPETPFEIKVEEVYFKNKLSPYIGYTLYGVVDRTIVRGNTVFDRDIPRRFAAKPLGQTVLI